MPVRNRLKTLVEDVLVGSGALRVARRRVRGAKLILAYHNIVPRGETAGGDRSLHLPHEAFSAQLDLLQEAFDVVSLDDLLGTDGGGGERPRVAVTFDDAYRGAVEVGLAELARRGLPATIFIAPAFVGGGAFWWDALATASGLPEGIRTAALHEARGEDAAVRRWAADRGLALHDVPEHARVAGEAVLQRAARQPGLTVGSHSWSHANLARLSEPEVHDELRRPLDWLRARFANVTDVLAYPYGIASTGVERAAASVGHGAGLLVSGGWVAGTEDRFRLPRLNVPAGLSRNGFAVRAAGLLCR